MSFYEKIQSFFEENIYVPKTPEEYNKNSDRIDDFPEEKEFKIPEDVKTFDDFVKLVNPNRGIIKKNCLFKYVQEFQNRNQDVLIINHKNKNFYTFYAVNRIELITYIASIINNEDLLNDFISNFTYVYTIEGIELTIEDYIDYLIRKKISIMVNSADKVYGATESDKTYKNEKEYENEKKK